MFQVSAPYSASNLRMDKIIPWGDYFAVTWHAAGEGASLISVCDAQST